MATSIDESVGTTRVRPGFEVDVTRLEAWMVTNVPDYSGSLRLEQFKGGQSNPTYKLITPGASYVLRRKPPGALLKGAHAIDREARVLMALAQAGFPAPKVFGRCEDEDVIGTWFYVMEMIEGRIFWDATVPGVSETERAAIFDSMNVAIARLHSLDYVALGLQDYGKPGDFFQRQIKRWSSQYFADPEAGRDANMDRLIDWLSSNVPSNDDAVSLAHGDFRIDNIIFHPSQPRVLAVLDWELSTLGHPGADFAYHAMMYRMRPHIVAGLGGVDIRGSGNPSEEDYVDAYCRRRNLPSLPSYDFYVAFSFFRLAAIFHGIKGRVIRGTAASQQAQERVRVLPELMALAWTQAEIAYAGH